MSEISNEIGVVIVTYKRLDYLKRLLNSYESLEMLPNYILVVDNGNNDQTTEFLIEWFKDEKSNSFKRTIMKIKENNGSAEGFHIGINVALKYTASWILVQDDDAFPENNMISKLHEYIENNDLSNVSALATTVMNYGKIDTNHRKRVLKGLFKLKRENISESEYSKEYFCLEEFSYVGALIKKDAIKCMGSTQKDLYVFYDDTEHSVRLCKYGEIRCIPSAIITHDKKHGESPKWQYYYYLRNRGLMIKKHYSRRYYLEYLSELLYAYILACLPIKNKYTEKRRIILDAYHDIKHDVKGKNTNYISES